MEWYENDEVWESLDDLVINMSPALLRLLKSVQGYEMSFYIRALLFGGLGQFILTYAREREKMTNEIEAFDKAMASVAENQYIAHMMSQMIGSSVDNRVAQMVGENE